MQVLAEVVSMALKHIPFFTFLIAVSLGFSGIAEAKKKKSSGGGGGTSCGSTVKQTTYYMPTHGGINGKCGTSASGYNACNYPLENHSKNWVMAAVPQKGGTSGMFGGLYSAPYIAKKIGASSVKIGAGDRYGGGSNHKCKMDVVVKTKATGNKINNASGTLSKIGTIKDAIGEPKRTVKRKPAAIKKKTKKKKKK